MNSRLEALISRGYPRDMVIRLASFTDEELDYASKSAFEHLSRDCTPVEEPIAIFIGGQPGCGKTAMSMNLKNEIQNAVEIGIDNYRMYHPRYLEIEQVIRDFWKDKKQTPNNTPGNDIADFTHYFAGAMTDRLMQMGSSKGYNLLLEWGMRSPEGPLKSMKEFKERGYNNVVLFVIAHKDISYEACKLRAEIMQNSSRIIRKVPKNFHDLCIETLPSSINTIYEDGYEEEIIDYMALVTRYNEVIWDDKSIEKPGDVYKNYLSDFKNYSSDKNNSHLAFQTNKKEMVGLTADLDELKQLKQQVILINPQIFTTDFKKK